MHLNPYLFYPGTCEEAFTFYQKALGGKIEAMMRYAGSPAESHVPAEMKDKIMHARITIGERVIMGGDGMGDKQTPQGFSICINPSDPDEADRIFKALSEGGKITMPLDKTFWARRFGMFTDRFGIPWMINCE